MSLRVNGGTFTLQRSRFLRLDISCEALQGVPLPRPHSFAGSSLLSGSGRCVDGSSDGAGTAGSLRQCLGRVLMAQLQSELDRVSINS